MAKKKEKIEQSSQNLEDVAKTLSNIFSNPEVVEEDRWFLHSGCLALDYIMSGRIDGTGGYPSGIVEVHGDPSTGKSLLFAKAIATAQKLNCLTVLADAEGRWDYGFSALQGVDPDLLRKNTFYPETVEEFAVKSMELLTKVGKIVLLLDSVGILSTEKEKDDINKGDMKADQGRKAQKLKAAIRVLSSEIRKTGSLFLISNHVIDQTGSFFPSTTTPGGRGIPFQANVRLELKRPTPIKLEKKEHPIGVQLHVECTKNSVVAPFGSCDLDLYFASGIDICSGLVDLATDLGVIVKKGAYCYYKDQSFRASDIGVICKNTDFLKDKIWEAPYWMEVKSV